MADARSAMQQWANVLLTGLDDAEGRSSTTQPTS